MDLTALFSLNYGLYVLATRDTDGKYVGCVVNAAMQITAEPPSMAVSSNSQNYTTGAVLRSGMFTLSVFSEQAALKTISTFGFRSSNDIDKFKAMPYIVTESGMPVLTREVCAYVECKVTGSEDIYTHKLIRGDIIDSRRLSKESPMTYNYYHKVVKGKTPKKAASYQNG
ncbi:MAG: flavin reductase family protein [Clostridiales bacterium]|jgi:flavin reductase (DIM6/NTAB) family NADH-FMN oxidoreductase RutF|nr:flavin reductase family protein [Clostridiales bacterium]